MSQFIDELIDTSLVKKEKIVLEIGSNDSSMFELLRNKGMCPAGIDPSADTTASSNDGIIIRDFFTTSVAEDFVNKYGKVELIYSRHTLEHVFDPADFLTALSRVLEDTGLAVIEVPYMPAQLRGNQYAGMSVQHINFFTLGCLEYIGGLNGLSIVNAKFSKMDGGSIVVFFSKQKQHRMTNSLNGILKLERESGVASLCGLLDMFVSMDNSIKLSKEHILKLHEKSYRIIGYGAGSKGQAIFNMLGLPHKIIKYVVDDTPGSKGRYIPGAGTEVVDSSSFLLSEADYCLITAPTHVDEIVSKESNRHPNVAFIRTSPDFSYTSSYII